MCASSCLAGNLEAPQVLQGASLAPSNAAFEWLPDPSAPPQYHLNVVDDKTLLTDTDPNSPRQTPTGMGETKCTATGPLTNCTDSTGDVRSVLFYQVLSACGDLGADEGPICTPAAPCP